MDERRAGALALDHRLSRRAAEEVAPVAHGFAMRHRGLDDVYALNAVVLSDPLPAELDAEAVSAIADAPLGDLPHRRIVIDDDRAGARLARGLAAHGYEALRVRYMALAGGRALPPADPRARELTEPELRAIQLAVFTEDNHGPHASAALPARLVAAQAAVRATSPARGFGATGSGGDDGGVCSTATVFLDPDVSGRRLAMVEQVATLRAHRERGLGRAVVTSAVRAAMDWGAELIVVPVDADDWPQLMYASLGFTPVGEAWAFTAREPARQSAGSAGGAR